MLVAGCGRGWPEEGSRDDEDNDGFQLIGSRDAASVFAVAGWGMSLQSVGAATACTLLPAGGCRAARF